MRACGSLPQPATRTDGLHCTTSPPGLNQTRASASALGATAPANETPAEYHSTRTAELTRRTFAGARGPTHSTTRAVDPVTGHFKLGCCRPVRHSPNSAVLTARESADTDGL